MLEAEAPELTEGTTLAPELRAVLEDRLAVAGLDVFARRNSTGDVIADGDLSI